MTNLTYQTANGTGVGNLTLLLDPNLCTLETCDLSLSSFNYIPNLGGNAVFAAIFGACILGQLFFGIKYRIWGYMGAMILGLVLEVIGYAARVMLHNSPFNNGDFIMYLTCLTIAPALLSASVCSLPNRHLCVFILRISADIPLSCSYHRCLRRVLVPLQTSNLHHRILHLRLHLPCPPRSWWWNCIDRKDIQPSR